MTRPLRFLYSNACYHVMNRGARSQRIFHGARWYSAFLGSIAEAHERFGIEVHGYCLMPNHYHLLVKTPHANLDRAMRHIGGTYTQRYNRLCQTDGPLMRGRYRAIVVERDNYWHRLSRYIHRNPVDCKTPLVKHLKDYRWSSYRAFLDLEASPEWLYRQETLSILGVSAGEQYSNYVERSVDDELDISLNMVTQGVPILGSDAFKQIHLPANAQSLEEASRHEYQVQKLSIQEIVTATARFYGTPVENVTRSQRGQSHCNTTRPMAMYLCQVEGHHELKAIAATFGYESYGGISATLCRFRKKLGQSATLQSELADLRVFLSSKSERS